MTTLIPILELVKGDYADIEMNYKRTDITGYSIEATMWDSNKYSYTLLNLSIDEHDLTSSLAQDYEIKVNSTTYTITTTASMTYAQIIDLLNDELYEDGYKCILTDSLDEKDIKIKNNTVGSIEYVTVEAGDNNDLLTLLVSNTRTIQIGPLTFNKKSTLAGGDTTEINWTDTRAGYQELGLSIDSSTSSGAAAQLYDIGVNGTQYEVTLILDETYSDLATKLNTALGSSFTCEIVGTSPTEDIRITNGTEGEGNDVAITVGTNADLLTLLSSTPETAIAGYTNKGWYNIYVSNDDTKYFEGDSYIKIEVTDLNGNKTTQYGSLVLVNK